MELKTSVMDKGRNVHAPVLNRSEVSVAMPTSGSNRLPRGAGVVSLADVLPRGNWGTIWSRWRRWVVLNGGMPGQRVDDAQLLRPALRKFQRRLLEPLVVRQRRRSRLLHPIRHIT